MLILSLLTSIHISCRDKKHHSPQVIVEEFDRDSYYEKTQEVRDELYSAIDALIMSDDRTLICSKLKSLSTDNLSADVVIEVKDHEIDSIQLYGLLTFDPEQNPAKIYDSVVLATVTKAILVSIKYPEEDGLYGARIQLEKLCH